MGILRVKEDITEIIERDPYELIHLDEPHQIVRRLSPQYYGAAFVGVLIAFVAAFVAFYNANKSGAGFGDTVHAYFEIKAIDANGRPIAGAVVARGDEQVGVTDSFGEWRRFLRVTPGETFRVNLSKVTAEGELVAVKNIAVPAKMPESGDLELSGSVRMFASSQMHESLGKADVRQAQVPSANAMQAQVVAPAVTPPGVISDISRIWFVVDGQQSGDLSEVVSALRRRSLELGMRVDPKAALRIRLSTIAGESTAERGKTAPALVAVTGTYADTSMHEERFSFLRNFQETPYQTARDILWATTVHAHVPVRVIQDDTTWRVAPLTPKLWDFSARHLMTAGNEVVFAARSEQEHAAAIDGRTFTKVCPEGTQVCTLHTAGLDQVSPVQGWQRLKARVLGQVDADTRIYVSGYQAFIGADNQISFWGVPNGQANVTVLRSGKVLVRKRVAHSAQMVINLPTSVISKR